MKSVPKIIKRKIFTKEELLFDKTIKRYYFEYNNIGDRKYIVVGDKFKIIVDGVSINVKVKHSNNENEFPKGYYLSQKGFNKGLWFEDVDQFEYKGKLGIGNII